MAKGQTGSEDRAKVKFRVIEFELEGGNAAVESSIRQLAGAMTSRNAPPSKQLPAKQPKELAAGTPEADSVVVDAEVVDQEDEAEITPPAPKTSKPKSKPKAPTYVHDLMDADQLAAFKAFAKEKAPTSRAKQYLVATYWLKEFGGSPSVTPDKIYTCFKNADWPTNFNDWRATLDHLVHEEDMRKTGVGEFAINPTGEAKVK